MLVLIYYAPGKSGSHFCFETPSEEVQESERQKNKFWKQQFF